MKKSLVALAALAFVGVASAQSSVTLFGVVDAAVEHVSNDGAGSVTKLVSGTNATSRLGFRGTEDLGGGLNAGFWLEAGLNSDDGTGQNTSSNNQTTLNSSGGLTFNRRSTVSLAGNFGELRLGRDYTPSFWNHTVFDPFGTVGVGSALDLSSITTAFATGTTGVRASNSVGYFLPGNLGGFYGQAMYAMGENNSTTANSKDGNYAGVRLGYANGPVNVAIGYGQTKFLTGDFTDTNIGGSYNFGVATVMAQYAQEKVAPTTGTLTNKNWLLGVNVPVGPGNIVASYQRADVTGDLLKANKYAVGYVYNLSKRTALYGTYARISNSGNAGTFNVGSAGTGAPATTLGGSSSGLDIGLRHSF